MGSGGKKGHESFPIAPATDEDTVVDAVAAIEPVTVADQTILGQYTNAETIAGITSADSYGQLSQNVALAQAELAAVQAQPAESQMPQLLSESNKSIHAASIGWLDGKEKSELEQLALAEGFPHPQMVSAGALKAWLDPSYPADAEYKAKIAAKSIERYNAAVAAGTIVPLTPPELPEGHWKATPAEVLEAQSAFVALADQIPKSGPWWWNDAAATKLEELVAAESKLATAYCPEFGETLAASKAQAKDMVDARVAASHHAGVKLVKNAISSGQLDEHADLLTTSDAVALIRASTPADEKSSLKALIQQRCAQVDEMYAAKEKLTALNGGVFQAYCKPKPFASAQDIVDYNHAAKKYREGLTAFDDWHCVAAKPALVPADSFAQGLRHGAKSLSMDQLRAAATMQGLKDTKGASRAQLQNWMLGQWNSEYNQDEIAAKFAAKPKPTPAPTPPQTSPPPAAASPSSPATSTSPTTSVSPSSSPTTSSSSSSSSSSTPTSAAGPSSVVSPSATAGSGKWLGKQQQMVNALKHQTASLADAPPRPPSTEVASWEFSKGPSMHLGGMHTKEVVTAPDGSLWMFKPAKDPYRALSESGANGILHRSGIPTVPVYARPYNGKTGTVQPLMKGATTFPSDPGQWSQSDVDAIVRYHTAAWLVGDHDAKYDNLLRTPNGGVVPIDHGQAFKFWGQDKLAEDFHPNGAYGSKPPVWNVLYQAAKSGQLAAGVKVRPAAALPVIKQIESISDSEFKAMIEPAAKAGASKSSSSYWRSTFASRAAAKHGAAPTTQQVAEEFVAYGIERKNSVRKSFMAFFAQAGLGSAEIISKVA